ncbi:MAG: PilN domain-containing protein [Planctomycetota bacterium]
MLGSPGNSGKQGGSLGGGFLPEDYVQRKAENRANVIGLSLFCAVMGTVVAAFFVTNRSWTTVHQERESIARQYSAAEPEIEKLIELEEQKEQMLQKAEIVTALIEPIPRSILMAEIVTRMPEGMTLLTVELDGKRVAEAATNKNAKPTDSRASARGRQTRSLGGRKAGASAETETSSKILPPRYDYTLQIVGVTQANTEIADYLEALKASPLLRRVELAYVESQKIKELALRKFEISAQIDPRADARGIEPDLESADAMKLEGNKIPLETADTTGDEPPAIEPVETVESDGPVEVADPGAEPAAEDPEAFTTVPDDPGGQ